MLLIYIVGAHAKVQTEFQYLETGTTSVKYVITSRILLYLQNKLKRPQSKILRQVYEAQKENPVQGDWGNLVNEDL